MKKSIKIMGIAAMVLLLAVSCKKENKNGFNGETKFMTFSAGISQGDGKTCLDGLNLLWSEEDKININNAKFTLTNGAGSSKGEFEGEAEEAETYYAVYPYAESSSISGSTATVTLPAVQPYVAGSFAKNVAPMVAMTDDSKAFTFTNVCGLLRLNMTNVNQPFKKIVLQSAKADESLAGEGSVTISGDESDKFVITNGTGNKITVTSDENIASGAKIVFVLPAGTLTTGFNAYFYANADDATPFDNISGSGNWEIEAGQMNDVTVNHVVKTQAAAIQQDAVTTSSLKIPYVIQEECVKATIECATDDAFVHVVGTKVVVGGAKADPYKTGDVTFTGLSAATPYYVRILVQSEVGKPEVPYCTIVAETLGGDEPIVDEHQFVNFGTPNLDWSLYNLGVDPSQLTDPWNWYGDYYAWGETEPYYLPPLPWQNATNLGLPGATWNTTGHPSHSDEFHINATNGYGWMNYLDGNTTEWKEELDWKPYGDGTTLTETHDAAAAAWKNGWRMPTSQEWNDLYNNNTFRWLTAGTKDDDTGFTAVATGYLVVKGGKNNIDIDYNVYMFLPAAGHYDVTSLSGATFSGKYWSSSHSATNKDQALTMSLSSTFTDLPADDLFGRSSRRCGVTVRPVRTATK